MDVVAAQLTVTPERQKLVDFSNPTRQAVTREIVVTVSGSAAVVLSGRSGQDREAFV